MAKATAGDSSTSGDTTAGTNVTADATGTATPTTEQPSNAPDTAQDAPQEPVKSSEASQLPESADAAQNGGLYVQALDTGAASADSEEVKKAKEMAREEEAARLANPNKAVYRRNDDPAYFEVGKVPAESKDAENKG